jgi:hypothetical protein
LISKSLCGFAVIAVITASNTNMPNKNRSQPTDI